MSRAILVISALVISVLFQSPLALCDGMVEDNAQKATTVAKSESVYTIERASGERLAKAVGFYARARSHLIQALRAFDRASHLANPDALLDSEEWRSSVIGRAEDLERILAPQPRVSKGGVKFEGDSRLLNVTEKR